MEIITEITTDQLFNLMKKGTQNEKSFCEDLENNYYLFKWICEFLINNGFELTYLSNDNYNGALFICESSEINELDNNNFEFFKIEKTNKYLAIEGYKNE